MKIFSIIFLFLVCSLEAQKKPGFADEITSIEKKYDTLWDPSSETIVFTGSSSIRIWNDLENRFPGVQIVNTGFGGSQTSDLLYYSADLISKYNPKKVFIYEGDNDISLGKKVKEILATTKELIAKIRIGNPKLQIVLISAKPSLARWKLKGKFKRLNRRFEAISKDDTLTSFVDVWNPMLDGRKVKQDIFIQDGLHMNSKGYDIWYHALKEYVN